MMERKDIIALLTEVLPYEIPIRFNNEAFFDNIQKDAGWDFFKSFFTLNKWTIPLKYSVRKYGGNKLRDLALIHPITQIDISIFINHYDMIMPYQCTLSPFSLRHIQSVAHQKYIKESTLNESEENEEASKEIENEQKTHVDEVFKSYFTYKEVDFVFKFYEGFDFLRLEQKYRFMRKIDVSKCFYHIYTHSICWAIKGKQNAKLYANKSSFEEGFDKLMQHANYNETNGIVVGPEISRIFAEIIFQRIDNNVIARLRDEKLILGIDYEVRRYVDDHLVFANKNENLDIIETIYKEELSEYKLYLNESKTTTVSRPFITKETKARDKTKLLFGEFVERNCSSDEYGNPIPMIRPSSVYLKICKQFSMIASDYNISYGVINRILLTEILKFLGKSNDKLISILSVEHMMMITELSFFAFNLDMCFTASYKLCQIIIKIIDLAVSTSDNEIIVPIREKVIKQFKQTIDIYNASTHGTETNLEIQNLLLTIHERINYTPPLEVLKSIFRIKDKSVMDLDYFQICCLFFIMEKDSSYKILRDWLSKKVASRFEENRKLQLEKYANYSFLFLDMMTCPYLEEKFKKRIIIAYKGSSNVEQILATSKIFNRWFFDWDSSHYLYEFIKKKQYHPSYD